MEIEDSNYHLLDRVSITSSSEGFANADVAVLLGNYPHVFQLWHHRSINQSIFIGQKLFLFLLRTISKISFSV